MSWIAVGATVVGVGMGAAGTALEAGAAGDKRKRLAAAKDQWLPDIEGDISSYYKDMEKYLPSAGRLSSGAAKMDQETLLALRERALPGVGKAQQDQLASILPLLKGELPKGVIDSFMRSGGASSVGSGFGGSGFGFLNQGLFGARGSLGAIQLGSGLLSALLGNAGIPNSPGTAGFLSQITSPGQRTATQMQIRGQNIGIEGQIAGMKTGNEVWGDWLQESGGALMGAGLMGMGAGGGAGGGSGGWSVPAGEGGGFGNWSARGGTIGPGANTWGGAFK